MYYLISVIRKKNYKVDTRNRTIFYPYGNEQEITFKQADILCKEYGFARQAEMFYHQENR